MNATPETVPPPTVRIPKFVLSVMELTIRSPAAPRSIISPTLSSVVNAVPDPVTVFAAAQETVPVRAAPVASAFKQR